VFDEAAVASDPDLENSALAVSVEAPHEEANAIIVAIESDDAASVVGTMICSEGEKSDAVAVLADGFVSKPDEG